MNERAEVSHDDAAVEAPDGPFIESPMFAMKRAVISLGYQVPESVWSDLREKWNAVAMERRHLILLLREAKAMIESDGPYSPHEWLASVEGVLDAE